jgi:hypothetical protein
VYVNGIDKRWQADLVEMREFADENNWFNYLLTVIDCFSKYAWAIPIKNKTAEEIIKSFDNIFKVLCLIVRSELSITNLSY